MRLNEGTLIPRAEAFYTAMFMAPVKQELPEWMRNIILDECADLEIEPPAVMAEKDIFFPGYMGGYTAHPNTWVSNKAFNGTGIYLVYGDIFTRNLTDRSRLTLLHELAHWSVKKPEEGHSVQFYAELMRLSLKYDADFKLLQDDETAYMGNKVFEGIQFFDNYFNQGVPYAR